MAGNPPKEKPRRNKIRASFAQKTPLSLRYELIKIIGIFPYQESSGPPELEIEHRFDISTESRVKLFQYKSPWAPLAVMVELEKKKVARRKFEPHYGNHGDQGCAVQQTIRIGQLRLE